MSIEELILSSSSIPMLTADNIPLDQEEYRSNDEDNCEIGAKAIIKTLLEARSLGYDCNGKWKSE